MAGSHNTPVVCPQLIGREQQLTNIKDLITQTRGGTGAVALIAGEAGTGKSRLVAEIKADPANQEFIFLQGRCFEPDRALAHAPLLDLVRVYLSSHNTATALSTLAPAVTLLTSLLPELALLDSNLTPPMVLEPSQLKRRIAQAFVQFFLAATQIAPLVIVIEDIHWSDETSLDVLLMLARHTTIQPMLLLLTYRSDDLHPSLGVFLAALVRERLCTEISITPLDEHGVEHMLRAIFAQRRPIRHDFLTALYELTEGNPFFVEEVIKTLIASGGIFYAHGQWDRKHLTDLNIPRTVQVAVHQRVKQLDLAAQRLLILATIAGRRFNFGLLQQITGHDEPTMLQLMKTLIAAQLVIEESADTFAFRHALTREALYTNLLVRERQALHGSIADALEAMVQRQHNVGSYVQIADLSYHFYAAERWDKALVYAQQAAIHAQQVHALRPAITHLSRVLVAMQQHARSTPPALYHTRGQVYELLGEFEHACADYQSALASARATQDRIAEWQALLDLGFLWAARDYVQMGNYRQQALDVARTLDDPTILAQSLNRVGNWYLFAEQPHEALRYHHEALGLLQAIANAPGLASTYDLLGITHIMGDDLPASVEYYQHAVALWRALNNQQGLSSSLAAMALRGGNYSAITNYWPMLDFAACTSDGLEALRIARQIGWRPGEAGALVYLALSHGPRGEYQLALEHARAALTIAEEIEHGVWSFGASFALGVIALDLLDYSTARWWLEQALKRARELGFFFVRRVIGFLAIVHLVRGDIAQAEAVLAEAFDPAMPMEAQGQRLVWYAHAELALANAEPALALTIVDRLINSAAHASHDQIGCVPYLWRLRGEALASLGQLAAAEAILHTAHTEASRRNLAPIDWRILASLGRIYQRQGRRKDAEEALASAYQCAAALAIALDPEPREVFIRTLQSLLPAPLLTPRRSARDAFDGLTERERAIAALIAVGKTNRAIANTLIVGERTVETHISSIRSKLGFTSRQQIVVWAIQKGLTDPSIP